MHNFKYTLKTLLKNKMLIFWTFAFPIILGTFFNLAFSDIEDSESFHVMDIAILENEEFVNNKMFTEAFKTLGDSKNKDQLFNVTYVKDETDAKKLLEEEKVIGYLKITDEPEIVIKKNGIYQTIFNFVTDEIISQANVVNSISDKKITEAIQNNQIIDESFYVSIYTEVMQKFAENNANIKDVSRNNLSYTMIEFYTLIAMTCLYGGMLGMVAINRTLPNMGSVGKRIAVSPENKGKIIISSAIASYLIELVGLALLFVYTIFVLHVDYGNNLPMIILLSLVGTLAGLALGIFIATVFKTNENNKTGILIAVTMLGCFLSGMMGITMKYVIDKNIPIVNKLNPAAIITDGFYSLYYYDTLDRFYFNILSLLIFAIILLFISAFKLRRQKYDSI